MNIYLYQTQSDLSPLIIISLSTLNKEYSPRSSILTKLTFRKVNKFSFKSSNTNASSSSLMNFIRSYNPSFVSSYYLVIYSIWVFYFPKSSLEILTVLTLQALSYIAHCLYLYFWSLILIRVPVSWDLRWIHSSLLLKWVVF